MRVGTPAVTTRGLKEADMRRIVAYIDDALMNYTNEARLGQIKKEVNEWMSQYPLYQ